MAIDLVLAALVVVFGLFGLRSGAIRQLTHWAGLACGYFASGPLAALATRPLAPRLGLPPAAVRVVLSGFFFCALALIAGALVHRVLGGARGERENGPADRAGGFVLGTAKGTALLFALISGLLFFEKPLTDALGKPPAAVADSAAVGFVRRHNVFDVIPAPAAARLEKLLAAARDPKSAAAFAQDPQFKALLDNPALKAALQDKTLVSALESGDLSALKKDPRFAALFNDPRRAGGN
jgi:uncharacterized membrane protein required for colicin V production